MHRRLSAFSLSVVVIAAVCAVPGVAAAREVVQSSGTSHAPAVSTDGRYVAFLSDADNLLDGDPSADPNGVADVFLVDTTLGTIRLISDNAVSGVAANGPAVGVDISGDGRWVVFASAATNLVPGDSAQRVVHMDVAAGKPAIDLGNINIPIIVRLQGTNAEEAKKLIDESGLKVQSAILLSEAAELVKKAVA
jgi:hypothetical protein